MPELEKMQCHICEEIKSVEEISDNGGMCKACADALADVPEVVGDETDPELRGAIKRYQARQTYMKKYNQRPEVRQARKAYMKGRQQRDKELIRRAKDLHLIDERGNVAPRTARDLDAEDGSRET